MRARWTWSIIMTLAAALPAAGCLSTPAAPATPVSTADGKSVADKVETAMAEERSKPRFTGELGDFLIVTDASEANIFQCASTPVPLSDALKSEELWSDAFGDTGFGWACPGQGVTAVNNMGPGGEGSDGGDGSVQIRAYIRSVPLPLLWDAPRDRLELVTVEGHPGLLERPIPEYPYRQANLAVIERYPDGDTPGIAVFVEMAPSAEAAIKHAEEIMP
jgi:hypothetical protein